eukprot:GHVQ01029159.1.p1 GENE.GHVQ01029159.1~~GHVQ01029159.1.p1  ORF type:complete len:184 (-),score=33.27 GHVQ01029159.1:36-587(-)
MSSCLSKSFDYTLPHSRFLRCTVSVIPPNGFSPAASPKSPTHAEAYSVRIDFTLSGFSENVRPLLHWGVGMQGDKKWEVPISEFVDLSCSKMVEGAVQTSLSHSPLHGGGGPLDLYGCVSFGGTMGMESKVPAVMMLVIYCQGTDEWIKNGKYNFTIPVKSFLNVRMRRVLACAGVGFVLSRV